MSVKLTDTDLGFADLEKLLKDLAGDPKQIVVGIRQGVGSERRETVGEPGSRRSVIGSGAGPTIAEVAAKNEFGSDGVPERSFMRSTFDQQVKKYERQVSKGLARVVDGSDTLDTVLGVVGTEMMNDVQDTILSLRSPGNSQQTIDIKGSDNPLIDSGRMRQAIDYEVRDA